MFIEHITREANGGERCPQFMGHIRHKALLHLRQGRQFHDLALHAVGHLVEGPCQHRDDVLALLKKTLLEEPLGEAFRCLSCSADRANGQTNHKEGHHHNGHHKRERTRNQGLLNQSQSVLNVNQVVDQIQLVLASARNLKRRRTYQPGTLFTLNGDQH